MVAKTGRVPATPHDVAGDAADGGARRALPGNGWRRSRRRCSAAPTRPLTRAGGELGSVTADAERAFARRGRRRGRARRACAPTSTRGPITYAEVAEALAYGHPVVRAHADRAASCGELAAGVDVLLRPERARPRRGPTRSRPARCCCRTGAPVGTEVEALAWYLAALSPAARRHTPARCGSASTRTSPSSARGVVGCAIARELSRLRAARDAARGGPGRRRRHEQGEHRAPPHRLRREARARSRRGWSRAGTSCSATTRSAWASRSSARARCSWRGTRSRSRELPGILERARANGHTDLRELGGRRAVRGASRTSARARAARSRCRGEGLVCPFTTPLAYATEAVLAGCDLRRSTPVDLRGSRLDGGGFRLATPGGRADARATS